MMLSLFHRISNYQKHCLRLIPIKQHKIFFCTSSCPHSPEHIVIVSKSDSIFTNLALEEWLYENEDLTKKSILLMWKNKPTVVIGRHQNPWLECNVEEIVKSDIDLARRTSGGGTVYHDDGNLNCSFIKDRKWYNRKLNLELVVTAVTSMWDIDLSINHREDIVLDKLYKVSGTASKLGGKKTFHHFTLLYNVNTENLSRYLNSPLATVGVISKATQSLRSSVKNISDYVDVDFRSLVDVIGRQFLNLGYNSERYRIQWLSPNDHLFPGLTTICNRLQDWEWIYGKTPKFSIKKCFTKKIGSDLITLHINIEIDKGKISDIKIDLSPIQNEIYVFINEIISRFIKVKFWQSDLVKHFDDIVENQKMLNYTSELVISQWILSCFKNSLLYNFENCRWL